MTSKLSDPIKLQSGHELRIQKAGFQNAFLLQAIIAKEIGNSSGFGDINFKKITDTDIDFVKLIGNVIGSEEVYNRVSNCFPGCLLDNQNLNVTLFEQEEYRQDFYEVAFHVIKENVQDFLPQKFREVFKSLAVTMKTSDTPKPE